MKANNNKYGHVTANLENDYMKGNDYYPKTMPDAYKYLSEFNTGNSGKESYSRHSNHLAFMQGNLKDSGKTWYSCGNPGYTVRTCPVCNSKRIPNQPKGYSRRKSIVQNPRSPRK